MEGWCILSYFKAGAKFRIHARTNEEYDEKYKRMQAIAEEREAWVMIAQGVIAVQKHT